MEKQKENSGCTEFFWVFVGVVVLIFWGSGGISELYRRVSQPPVVGEWKGEDDQTVIVAFGKDGWFEMRTHESGENERLNILMSDADQRRIIQEETDRFIRERGKRYIKTEQERQEAIKKAVEQAIRGSEGAPNMRYKIDYDEDPVWLDIIVFGPTGNQMLTIKCIMKQPNRNTLIVKFPIDYTQLLGHISLEISRYDRPTSFSGQEENRIKLLRKATLAVPLFRKLLSEEHGVWIVPLQPAPVQPAAPGTVYQKIRNVFGQLISEGDSPEGALEAIKATGLVDPKDAERIYQEFRRK